MTNSRAILLKKKISKANATILEFHSKSCPSKNTSAKLIDNISNEIPIAVEYTTIDVKKHETLVEELDISCLPTTVFLSNGKEMWRKCGTLSEADLRNGIEKCL